MKRNETYYRQNFRRNKIIDYSWTWKEESESNLIFQKFPTLVVNK